jgi:hypothetical protein
VIDQQAGRFAAAASHPSAQLVQLRQAETLGMFHHHDGGFRHVDPTSITVVATSIRVSPDLKAAMAASRSGAFMRPCTSPTFRPSTFFNMAARSSAAARSIFSDSSTSGQTQ